MSKRTALRRRTSPTTRPSHQGKARCLRILRALSAFIDDELSNDVCTEVRQHIGACPNCEDFVASLRQTVSLCRHRPTPTLSSADRARMREQILTAVSDR
jgi:anti-sigma factor RsiW